MTLWVYLCQQRHVCFKCEGSGMMPSKESIQMTWDPDSWDSIVECEECSGTGELGDAKIERLERGKRRRPNPYCHLCGKKMKFVKYPGANFELKGKGWSK